MSKWIVKICLDFPIAFTKFLLSFLRFELKKEPE